MMPSEMRPADVVLTGTLSQGIVSRAIKYGSVLRFQPAADGVATALRWLLATGAIVLAVVFGWSLLGALAALVVAGVLGIVATWATAAAMAQRNAYWFRYSHCALIVPPPAGEHGLWIAEAAKVGVRRHAFRFASGDYTHIPTHLDEMSRARVLEFVDDTIAVRETYGFLVFAGLSLYCITGSKLVVQKAGTSICSGFVCGALAGAGPDVARGKLRYTWPRPPAAMMPANIAAYFHLP